MVLDATIIWDHPTIDQLGDHLDQLRDQPPGPPPALRRQKNLEPFALVGPAIRAGLAH